MSFLQPSRICSVPQLSIIIRGIKSLIYHIPGSPLAQAATAKYFSCESAAATRNTIYAVATGGIRCALTVVRVSGPHSVKVLQKIGRFRASSASSSAERKLPEPRKATLRKLYDPESDKIIDHGILLWFPGPNSFTGEDSCEFHVHGGPAVVTKMLQAIGSVPGCRIAEPGEFSKRAFLNGKMDLTAVEGLGDLISAETEMQRVQALNQMSGSLGSLYESWRDRMAKCLANAEAFIDFGEDENIEPDVLEKVEKEIECLLEEMTNHLKDQKKGERLRNGVRVAILGKANVGKSSLLNILSKRDAAIVSNIPGTTRDVVEAPADFGGYPVVFADTAGIRVSPDEIEKEGIRRAIQEAIKADLVVVVMSFEDISQKLASQYLHQRHDRPTCSSTTTFADASVVVSLSDLDKRKLVQEELAELLLETSNTTGSKEFLNKVVLVANKADLEFDTTNTNATACITSSAPTSASISKTEGNIFPEWRGVFDACISCKTMEGLEAFTELLVTKVAKMCTEPEFESPYLTRERHRSHVQNCIESLKLYLDPQQNVQDVALRTHHLKVAVNNIGYITGHVHVEDILDIIFRDFCIGK